MSTVIPGRDREAGYAVRFGIGTRAGGSSLASPDLALTQERPDPYVELAVTDLCIFALQNAASAPTRSNDSAGSDPLQRAQNATTSDPPVGRVSGALERGDRRRGR